MKLSVIIPCCNEEGNVKKMYEKTSEVLNQRDFDYELLFIDDGSDDKTFEIIKNIYEADTAHVRCVSFSRRFKKEAGLYAGICHASGEYTAIIDGDLQQNPKYLLKMLDFLDDHQEFDQICMIQKERKADSFLSSFLKKCFYKTIDFLSDVKFVNGASDFRMFRSNVREAIVQVSERNRFSKGIFAWIGFPTKYDTYEVEQRTKGKTKFNLLESFRYAFDGIISFSAKPLTIATICGTISSLIAFIYFIVIIVQKLAFGIDVAGYASLMCVVLFLGGIQLITIGILGKYLSKTYVETKRRPIYVVREKLGLDEKDNIL